jgi:cytochrome c-type biogenesis protein
MADTQSIGLAVAFTAGLLSFLSPCVLPLIPSYVTFITGMSLDELTTRDRDRRAVLVHAVLFVIGFTLVFMLMGASASFLGGLYAYSRQWVARLGGVLLILFGVYLLGLIRLPGATRARRPAGE